MAYSRKVTRLRARLRNHRRFTILLLVFMGLTQYYSWAIAPFEGPDEPEHLAYIAKLAFEHELPNPQTDFDGPIQQESAQPPLYYLTAALWTALGGISEWEHHLNINYWAGDSGNATGIDNRNQFLMSPDFNVLTDSQKGMVRALRWVRLLSLVYGVLTLVGLYWAGQVIWPHDRQLPMFATLLFALTPVVLHGYAVVSNDVAVISFGALTLATALAIFEQGSQPRLLVLAGVFMGLAGLSKASGLATWALPPAAVLLAGLRTKPRSSLAVLIGNAALPVIIAIAISGWWYVRGYILFDDPLGTQPHLQMDWALEEPRSLAETFDRLPLLFKLLWAEFGWGAIRPGRAGYVVPAAILIISAVGWLKTRQFNLRTLLLVLYVLIGLLAFLRWMQLFVGVYARLLLPYYGAFILLVTIGLSRLPRHVLYWLSGAIGISALLMVSLVIRIALGPPALYDDIDLNLKPPVMNFFGPRFLGYQLDREVVHTGDDLHFTLCWEAPPGDSPLPVPYPFTIQLVGPDNQPVASRESYPGMGTYTLWEPGKAFCDEVNLTIENPLEPGRVYPLWLTLFEYDTKNPVMALSEADEVLPQRWIGAVRSPAEKVSPAELESAETCSGDICLLEYSTSAQSEHLQLELIWGVRTMPVQPLTARVWLEDDAGNTLHELTHPLGGEKYPVELWKSGDRVVDPVMIEWTGNQPYTIWIEMAGSEPVIAVELEP